MLGLDPLLAAAETGRFTPEFELFEDFAHVVFAFADADFSIIRNALEENHC
jgi:hypothetical protein